MAIDTQNEERKEKLKEIIKMKEPLAFIGAGCSKQYGYPSWSELLQLMQDEVVKIYPDLQSKVDILMSEKDKLWIAQELRKLMGEDAFIYHKGKLMLRTKRSLGKHKVDNRVRYLKRPALIGFNPDFIRTNFSKKGSSILLPALRSEKLTFTVFCEK